MSNCGLLAARVVLAVLPTLPAACGASSGSARGDADSGASLEVVNLSWDDREISVRGRVEGTVRPGERVRWRHLSPGRAVLLARVPAGDGAPASGEVELTEGGIAVFRIPGDAPEPPSLTDLRVESSLRRHLLVSLDGRPLGRVLAGDSRTFRDVPAGSRKLDVLDPEDGFSRQAEVVLREDEPFRWRIEVALATIRVLNDTGEPAVLEVDGRARGRLEPGESLLLDDVPEGRHDLRAVGAHTEKVRLRSVLADPAAPVEWSLTAGRGQVRVVNRTGEALELTLPKSDAAGAGAVVEVPVEGDVLLSDLVPGDLPLRASGSPSGAAYAERVEVAADRVVTWSVTPIRSTLRVENATAIPLSLRLDGEDKGRIVAGGTRVVGGVDHGRHEVVAVSLDGRTVHHHVVLPGGPGGASWRIAAAAGAVHVDNGRDEEVHVFVDSLRLGSVGSGEAVTFTGVAAGDRLLEAVGASTGAVTREVVHVREDAVSPFRLADLRASLLVTNETGEPLFTEGALAAQKPRVAPGEKFLFRLGAGAASLRVVGTASGVAFGKEVEIAPGEIADWVVQRVAGALRVESRLTEPARLDVDEGPAGRVAPGGSLHLADVAPGLHRLRASGETSGRVWEIEVVVPPAGEARWELAPRPTEVLVENGGDEPVAVTFDGRPHGRVEAGAAKRFGAVPAGRRKVLVLGLVTGWRYEAELTLEPGAREIVRAEPPSALLAIDNQSGEAQVVSLNGVEASVVEPGASDATFAVPAGRLAVLARGRESGRTAEWRVEAAPSRRVDLVLLRPVARLVVVNRTSDPREIRSGDRRLGSVAAGESLVADDLEPGEVDLEARHPSGLVTHRERRRLARGETSSWVLPGPPATP